MTAKEDVVDTAKKVVAELPAPFTKEDFLAAYRRSRGKAFPTLKSLNLNVSTFPKFFNYLPDVYDTDFEGEYFYCDPEGPRSRNDLRRELRLLQEKRYQQFKDRVVFIARGMNQPFKIADLEKTLKMKYPEHGNGLPLKKFGFHSAAVLMEQLADRIRDYGEGIFEYFGEDDVEEPPPVPRTLTEAEVARIAAATVTPNTPPADRPRPRDDVIATPANTMGHNDGREQQKPTIDRRPENQPSEEAVVNTIHRRGPANYSNLPIAIGVREPSTSPRAPITVKRELPDVEILEDAAPRPAKRSVAQDGAGAAMATRHAAARPYDGGQPAMNETFVIQAAAQETQGIGRFLQAMMHLPQTAPAGPSAKLQAFGTFIACRLDEAERQGRDMGEITKKIHDALTGE